MMIDVTNRGFQLDRLCKPRNRRWNPCEPNNIDGLGNRLLGLSLAFFLGGSQSRFQYISTWFQWQKITMMLLWTVSAGCNMLDFQRDFALDPTSNVDNHDGSTIPEFLWWNSHGQIHGPIHELWKSRPGQQVFQGIVPLLWILIQNSGDVWSQPHCDVKWVWINTYRYHF